MSIHSHRTLTASVSFAAVVGLTLAGCSGSGDNNDDDAEFSGETLEVSGAWSGAEQENFEKVLDKFEQDTGATVNYSSFGDKAATTLGTQIEGGSPPNVAMLAQPALMTQLAQDGNLVPLSQDVLDEVNDNYSQSWIDLGTVDGEVYGVWFKASNKSTVWYNADIWGDAGAEPPESWDDFLTQLQLVADSGYAGISIGADVGWPLTDWFENVYLQTAGGDMYDQLAAHEIPWTDPSVATALETLATLWGNSALVEPGSAQRTFPESVSAVFGADPTAGTVYEGDFVAGVIKDEGVSVVGENALFFDFPLVGDAETSIVGGGDVAVAFTDDAATQALMEYLASPESAEVWVPEGGLTSPNKDVDTALYPDETAKKIAEALTGAEVFRFDMSDLTPSAFGGTEGQGFWQIMIQFLENPTDIPGTQQALEDAAVAAY
ncbi:ABC transporter substrate-binding protein [Homoserinimonas hongtaonis]|uniref:Sugar ABC transporter substrate-binding protein n=1 Tax=Homoserinimonas hongtaonis TaxID=2079791 RepID=A0A2U1T0L0_9MICO|nr:ABC transporter substrate-binding protein [Salinibacterium hongtaonis]PWB97396.1 sugar ABC transporter substrate-binding protein [Salinibacterium hongtaonis]